MGRPRAAPPNKISCFPYSLALGVNVYMPLYLHCQDIRTLPFLIPSCHSGFMGSTLHCARLMLSILALLDKHEQLTNGMHSAMVENLLYHPPPSPPPPPPPSPPSNPPSPHLCAHFSEHLCSSPSIKEGNVLWGGYYGNTCSRWR